MNSNLEYAVGATVELEELFHTYILVVRDIDRADPDDLTYQCEVVSVIARENLSPVPPETPMKVGARVVLLASDMKVHVEPKPYAQTTLSDVLRSAELLTTDAAEDKAGMWAADAAIDLREAMAEIGKVPYNDGVLTTDAAERKASPVYSGFVKYFPLAMVEVARCSKAGNDQHNPGTPLHWDRSKSGDELDACMRHLMEAGGIDTDGVRHSTKAAWRAMANLEKELEAARKAARKN